MIARALRFSLRHSQDFFADPFVVRTAHLRAFYKPVEESGMKFSIIVRKTHGKAHDRAKTRRQLRSALSALFATQPQLFTAPYAVAVLVQGAPQPYSLYEQELVELITKLSSRFQSSSPEMA